VRFEQQRQACSTALQKSCFARVVGQEALRKGCGSKKLKKIEPQNPYRFRVEYL